MFSLTKIVCSYQKKKKKSVRLFLAFYWKLGYSDLLWPDPCHPDRTHSFEVNLSSADLAVADPPLSARRGAARPAAVERRGPAPSTPDRTEQWRWHFQAAGNLETRPARVGTKGGF